MLFFFSNVNSSNFFKNDWISIENGKKYFLHKYFFSKDRHKRRVLEFQNLYLSSLNGAMSIQLLTEYDCKKYTFRLVNHRGFSKFNLSGKLMYDWKGFEPRAFVGVPFASPANKVLNLVCGYTRKIIF